MAGNLYSDIQSVIIDEIYEATLRGLYARTYLLPTVLNMQTTGMQPRKVNQYGTVTVNAVPEGTDLVSQAITPTALSTLTPATHAAQVLLYDTRVASDPENIRAESAMILTEAFSQHVDKNIAGNFTSLTGGTVNAYATSIGWDDIFDAYTKLKQGNAPGPYFAVMGFGQWRYLAGSALLAGNQLDNAPQFRDRFVNNYFVPSMFGGEVTIVISNNIPGANTGSACGAMYSPMALAYDERRGFSIEVQRDSSRFADELNASLWYAHGTWRPLLGVQIRSKDDPI